MSVLLDVPWLDDPEHQQLLVDICATVATRWSAAERQQLGDLFATYSPQQLQRLVNRLQGLLITGISCPHICITENASMLLHLAYDTNETSMAVSYTEFYNEALNMEPPASLEEDHANWSRGERFSFCRHPFLYGPAKKAELLRLENRREQHLQLFERVISHLFTGGHLPHLVLRVRREQLVSDTIIQLQHAAARAALKQQLKVVFIGEVGVDEGGVQREFFSLVMRQLMDPSYGMFTFNSRGLYWFSHLDLSELEPEFELVGILLGLALFNGNVLEFAFPKLIFRKLLGQAARLEDLQEAHPEIHSNLQKLLAMREGVSDLGLVFQVEAEEGLGSGGVRRTDLLPDGGSIPVTAANRQQYAELYARHLLDTSISRQFVAFARGFKRLCNGPAFEMFRPEELELLICGGTVLDFTALQHATLYANGFSPDSRVVQWFWEVVHGFSETQQKGFLSSMSGTDRVPINGLGALSPPLTIAFNGPFIGNLPTDKATLKRHLEIVIDNAEGFGLN